MNLRACLVVVLNGRKPDGAPWETVGTFYPSKGGNPLAAFIHAGGHPLDPAEPGLIVKFFRPHPGS